MDSKNRALVPVSCGPVSEIPTPQLIELYGEIAARNSMYCTKALHDRYWECRKELETRFTLLEQKKEPNGSSSLVYKRF